MTMFATTTEEYVAAATNSALARLDAELGAARTVRDLPAMLDAVNAAEVDLLRLEAFGGAR